MNLPDYFLADLPPDATLSPSMITEACRTLRRNREQFLAQRSTESIIEFLTAVAKNWLREDYPIRQASLEEGPERTGFSSQTLRAGLEGFFRELTPENFQLLIDQDLGHSRRLDEIVASEPERRGNRSGIATAPVLQAHVGAGNLPNPTFLSMTLGMLTRSAQFVKCASGASFLPRLFAHSLYEMDPKLGACIEIAEWQRPAPRVARPIRAEPLPRSRFEWPQGEASGGETNGGGTSSPLANELTRALFTEADCITATGDDDALEAVRKLAPAGARFIGYGHRLSFAFISSAAWSGGNASRLAESFARDVTAWDQLGCLSPHVLYVENGGTVTPVRFAEMLARELERMEGIEPRGCVSSVDASAIASRRSLYEIRAAHSEETRLWCSRDSTAWTVVFETEPRFQVSCLNRFVYVKPVANLTDALQAADSVRGKVSTVGLAAGRENFDSLATQLARWGAARISPLGKMQAPPLCWRHDGRPVLAELVSWTDVERD